MAKPSPYVFHYVFWFTIADRKLLNPKTYRIKLLLIFFFVVKQLTVCDVV